MSQTRATGAYAGVAASVTIAPAAALAADGHPVMIDGMPVPRSR